MQPLPPSSESPMPTSQFFPSSSKLSKEEGGKRKKKKENEPKPAFMKPYINADEEFKVLKRVRGGGRKKCALHRDKMQQFCTLSAAASPFCTRLANKFSRD